MRKFKRIFVTAITVVAIGTLGTSFLINNLKKEEGITGKEWVTMQSPTFEGLEKFIESMDDVYALYTTQVMNDVDFKNEVAMLNVEYKSILRDYEILKANNNIKPGTHTYVSKRATIAVDNIFKNISNILTETYEGDNTKSPQEISYIYLAYKENIKNSVADYITTMCIYEIEERKGGK